VTGAQNKPKYYGKLAKVGVVWGFLREGGNSLLILPTTMVLARLLTPTEAGIAAAATFFVQLCARLTQFGFGASLVRAKRVTSQHLSSVFFVNLTIGVTAWSLLTLLAPLLGGYLRSPEAGQLLPTAACAFLIMPFATVPTALLSRDMRYKEAATSEWISTVVESSTAIGFAWSGYSFWSLIYGRLCGDSVRAICRIAMTRWRPRLEFSRDALGDLFSFGIGMYAKSLLDFSAQNLDNVIVGRMLGVTSLGFYDKAFTTMHKLTAKLNLSGPSVSFRIFALIHEEPERFRRAYRKVILSVTAIGYPVITGMLVTGPQLIEVLFGPRWLPAVAPFQILCCAAYFRLLNTYASSASQAKGQVWLEVKRQAFFTGMLIVAVTGLSGWGIAGAAAGVLVATIVMSVAFQVMVRRITNLTWDDMLRPQLPGVVCSFGLAAILLLTKYCTRQLAGDVNVRILFLVCIAVSLAYCSAFLVLSPFHEVRGLVYEGVTDFAPKAVHRMRWLAPPSKNGANVSSHL
jgi:O-antigen/teichoic acid export membrane protein